MGAPGWADGGESEPYNPASELSFEMVGAPQIVQGVELLCFPSGVVLRTKTHLAKNSFLKTISAGQNFVNED
jgi:hypothetical protein